ncbi:MAG TPA: S8 family serine peptidase [Burkholderiaceae bacterium]|nr:S8 family serine peptidase [Burkholderiaceae bacterium]
MRNLRLPARAILASALLLLVSTGYGAPTARVKVTSQADLPRFSYSVHGAASELLQADDPTFNAFAANVRADLDRVLRDFDIQDKSTLRVLLEAKLNLQELAGEYAAGLETVEALRQQEEKPAQKLLSGLPARARLKAAIEAHGSSGSAYEQAFVANYRDSIRSLPWEEVQAPVKRSFARSRVNTRSAVIGDVKTELDPAVKKSGALDNREAWDLISARNDLKSIIPLEDQRADVLRHYIAEHNVEKPDIWAAREVTLNQDQKLAPVLVGIWDSGIDVSLFPGRVFDDPKPTESGTHGLAFDDQGAPAKGWLYPLTAQQQKAYPEFRDQIKGLVDLEGGIDSPEAQALQVKFKTLSPEQMHDMFELDKVVGFYIHGTHCAGIAVRGNPFARLVVARFNDQLPDLPFAPTPEWAHRLGADFRQMGDYFRTRNVRVVNMSWGDEPQEFETWLSKTGGGADPAARQKLAAELFNIWRDAISSAIEAAPNTLFVTAAGNSDSSVGFIQDVPASLHLPNLITVGAVNQAGDETSFTSHGEAVVVHANGYNVESVVPGGTRLKLSGTSMAAPNVVNLAAKLFALDPSLTPERAIKLIKDGATATADGRRHLIDENRSAALLKSQNSQATN